MVLEKTLESPLNCKEIQPVHPKGNQSWIFIGRTDVEAETPILWQPDAKNRLIGKDPDAGKDWGWEEKRWQRLRWMVGWLDGVYSFYQIQKGIYEIKRKVSLWRNFWIFSRNLKNSCHVHSITPLSLLLRSQPTLWSNSIGTPLHPTRHRQLFFWLLSCPLPRQNSLIILGEKPWLR